MSSFGWRQGVVRLVLAAAVAALMGSASATAGPAGQAARPNFLWLIAEDFGPEDRKSVV